jgi:hypothetical protein
MRHVQEEREIKVNENRLLCPINQTIMDDPVIASDGYTYNRSAITDPRIRGISPITRQPITNVFVVNRAIKDLIDEYNAAMNAEHEAAEIEGEIIAEEVAQPPVNPIAYSDLLKQLQESLNVQSKEIKYGSIVEQTLVAMAGIYTNQKGASFDKDNDQVNIWNLCFCLNFASPAEHQMFVLYYRNIYAGSILNNGAFADNCAKVIFDTKLFSEVIVPALGAYRRDSHNLVMRDLCSKLNVDFQEIYVGDAVERRLVAQAGIFTSQKEALYRRNEDYSTVFHLAFANSGEYQQFIDYYQQNYPNFIIRQYGYKQGELCKIDVNSKLLLSQIAPRLSENLEHQERGCVLI